MSRLKWDLKSAPFENLAKTLKKTLTTLPRAISKHKSSAEKGYEKIN